MVKKKEYEFEEQDDDALKSADQELVLKPAQCRSFMRKKLAAAFPRIVRGFVEEAASGSCAHVKLASELLERAPRKLAARKGSAQKLLEKLGSETE